MGPGRRPAGFHLNRIGLAKELWRKMEDRFEVPGRRYQKLRRVFGQGLTEYLLAARNVTKYIGGIYHRRDHVGDPGNRLPFETGPGGPGSGKRLTSSKRTSSVQTLSTFHPN